MPFRPKELSCTSARSTCIEPLVARVSNIFVNQLSFALSLSKGRCERSEAIRRNFSLLEGETGVRGIPIITQPLSADIVRDCPLLYY